MYRETNRRRLLSDLGVHVPAYTVLLSAERRSGVGEFGFDERACIPPARAKSTPMGFDEREHL